MSIVTEGKRWAILKKIKALNSLIKRATEKRDRYLRRLEKLEKAS